VVGFLLGVIVSLFTGAMGCCMSSPLLKSFITILDVVGRLVAYAIAAIFEAGGAVAVICGGLGSIILAIVSSACSFVNSFCTLIPCWGWCYNLCGWIPGLLSSCGSFASYAIALSSLCVMDITTLCSGFAYPGAACGILGGDIIAMIAPVFMAFYKVVLTLFNICTTLFRCCPGCGWLGYCCESSIAWICNILVSAVCGVIPVGVGGIIMGICGIVCALPWAILRAIWHDLRDACLVWCCL